MKTDMQLLPIDSIPVSTPTWADIAGKAHNYKTARLRSTGEYVAIIGVNRLDEPRFAVRGNGIAGLYRTDQLCAFCL